MRFISCCCWLCKWMNYFSIFSIEWFVANNGPENTTTTITLLIHFFIQFLFFQENFSFCQLFGANTANEIKTKIFGACVFPFSLCVYCFFFPFSFETSVKTIQYTDTNGMKFYFCFCFVLESPFIPHQSHCKRKKTDFFSSYFHLFFFFFCVPFKPEQQQQKITWWMTLFQITDKQN